MHFALRRCGARVTMTLSRLSGDEQGILFVQLCNVLDPGIAVALSSVSNELRTATRVPLQQLKTDHKAVVVLCCKLGHRNCKALREAKAVHWCHQGLAADELELLDYFLKIIKRDFAPRRHAPGTDADAEIASAALSEVRLPTPTGLWCRFYRQGQWSPRFLCRLALSPSHTHAGHACPHRHPLDNFQVMRCAAAVRVWSENAEDLGSGRLLHPRRARSFMFDTRAQLARQCALEASKRRPDSCCRVVVATQELQSRAGVGTVSARGKIPLMVE